MQNAEWKTRRDPPSLNSAFVILHSAFNPMPLIKSAHVPPGVAAFSMRDVENAAKMVLLRAQNKAEALLVAAQEQAEVLKGEGYQHGLEAGQHEGFTQGKEQGLKAGTQQALAEHKAAFTA